MATQVTGKTTKSTVIFDKSIISEKPIGSVKIPSDKWPIDGQGMLMKVIALTFLIL